MKQLNAIELANLGNSLNFEELITSGYDASKNTLWPLITGGYLDRSDKITASEIGMCERRIRFTKDRLIALKEAGTYIPDEGTSVNSDGDWGFFARGHTVEHWVCKMLDQAIGQGAMEGVTLLWTGADQRSFVHGNRSSTPDGVILYHDLDTYEPIACGVLEIKSISERVRTANLPKTGHEDQCTQNLDLISKHYDLPPVGSYFGIRQYFTLPNNY